jgi:hypothetical protein
MASTSNVFVLQEFYKQLLSEVTGNAENVRRVVEFFEAGSTSTNSNSNNSNTSTALDEDDITPELLPHGTINGNTSSSTSSSSPSVLLPSPSVSASTSFSSLACYSTSPTWYTTSPNTLNSCSLLSDTSTASQSGSSASSTNGSSSSSSSANASPTVLPQEQPPQPPSPQVLQQRQPQVVIPATPPYPAPPPPHHHGITDLSLPLTPSPLRPIVPSTITSPRERAITSPPSSKPTSPSPPLPSPRALSPTLSPRQSTSLSNTNTNTNTRPLSPPSTAAMVSTSTAPAAALIANVTKSAVTSLPRIIRPSFCMIRSLAHSANLPGRQRITSTSAASTSAPFLDAVGGANAFTDGPPIELLHLCVLVEARDSVRQLIRMGCNVNTFYVCPRHGHKDNTLTLAHSH